MGLPGLIWGGSEFTDPAVPGPTGVFATDPGATPKYAINKGPRDNEFRETMARMFIEMGAKEVSAFVDSCPPETRPLAKVLAGTKSGSGGKGFVDFLLTSASENLEEKYQVVESLSDNFIVYFFGQKATMFQYSGTLINTYQDDQRVWMTRLYRDVLRGTQLARRRKLVRLRYDSVIVSGVFVGLQQSIQGDLENGVSFSFGLIPMQYVIFSPPYGSPTQLTTNFTEGGAYGLQAASLPNQKGLRTATPLSAPAEPAKKPAVQTDITDPDIRVEGRSGAETLTSRAAGGSSASSSTQQTNPNVYPGV